VKNEQKIPIFEKAEKQLKVFLDEVGELSRKRPNEAVNTFKLEFINVTLKTLNEFLGTDRPFPGFDCFDPDKLPSNSDVRFILAQYAASVLRYRTENTMQGDDFKWHWIVGKKLSRFKTTALDD